MTDTDELAALSQQLVTIDSVNPSLVPGGQRGQEWASYPAVCRLSIERRTVPGETAQEAEAEIQHLLDMISAQDATFQASVPTVFVREPLHASSQSSLVEMLQRHVGKVLGRELSQMGFSGWTDAALLSGAGIPSVIFGPTGEGLHGVAEWVDLLSVQQCSVLATREEF